jgi:hypothetical protein
MNNKEELGLNDVSEMWSSEISVDDFESEIRRRRNERVRRRKLKLEEIERDYESQKVKTED